MPQEIPQGILDQLAVNSQDSSKRARIDLKTKLCPRFGTPCKKDLCWAYKVSQERAWAEDTPLKNKDTGRIDYFYTGRILFGTIVTCAQQIFPNLVVKNRYAEEKDGVKLHTDDRGEYTGVILDAEGEEFQVDQLPEEGGNG